MGSAGPFVVEANAAIRGLLEGCGPEHASEYTSTVLFKEPPMIPVFQVWRDEGEYIGVCDALNITVQESTWRALVEAIDEALDLTLRTLLEDGDLDRS